MMQQSINTSFKSTKPGSGGPAPEGSAVSDHLQAYDWGDSFGSISTAVHTRRAGDSGDAVDNRPLKRLKVHQDPEIDISATDDNLDRSHANIIDQPQPSITTGSTTVPVYAGFEVLRSPNVAGLASKLFLSPIKSHSQRPGILYLYTRLSDPDHVKLGSTYSDSITRRSGEIRSRCKYAPRFDVVMENVMFAGRVELLIHRELEYMGLRRREVVCRYGSGIGHDNPPSEDKGEVEDETCETSEMAESQEPSKQNEQDLEPTSPNSDLQPSVEKPSMPKFCRGNHREWFFLSIEGDHGARRLLESWASFFMTAQPYSLSTGILKPEWFKKVTSLPVRDRLLSVNVLWAMWAEIQFEMEVGKRGFGSRVEGGIAWTKERRRLWAEHLKDTERQGGVVVDKSATAGAIPGIEEGDGGLAHDHSNEIGDQDFCIGCGKLDHGVSPCAMETVSDANMLMSLEPWW